MPTFFIALLRTTRLAPDGPEIPWPVACTLVGHRPGAVHRGGVMGKYVLAWLLGVPASVLALIYIVSNAGCS